MDDANWPVTVVAWTTGNVWAAVGANPAATSVVSVPASEAVPLTISCPNVAAVVVPAIPTVSCPFEPWV